MIAPAHRVLVVATLCAASLCATKARAADAPTHAPLPGYDGVYGRLDGNLVVAGSLGAEFEDGGARGGVRLSLHYLWSAGIYGRYADAFGSDSARARRSASFGADVRPLFLPRFARDLEQGPAFIDLALDSLSLNAGAYFSEPRGGDFGEARGFEMGLGGAIPLCGSARGLWLEGRAERRFADRGPSAWLFTLALGFHAIAWPTDAARP